jgi:hypothetical protein
MLTRQEERWATAGATATGFLVLIAHSLLETARDALFLSNEPVSHLPWMYLVLALLGVFVSEAALRTGRQLDVRRLLISSQAIAVVGTLAVALLIRTSSEIAYYALYVWVGIASMSVLVRYWQHLSGAFTVTQAKRRFPLIGAGSVAGALAGYALADVLARTAGITVALPVAAGFFALSMLGPLLFFVSDTRDDEDGELMVRAGVAESIRAVLSHGYLRRLATIMVIASATLTVSDYVFKSVVVHEVEASAFGSFFARAYFAFNGVSLFVLGALVTPLLTRLGVTRTLALLPGLLLVSGLGVVVFGGVAAALALKGVDGALRFSTHKTAVELLYIPISRGLRNTVKSAMDVLAQRFGQAFGSLVILLSLLLSDSPTIPAAVVVCTSLAWVVLAVGLRESYLDLFRETLSHGPDEAMLDFPDLDVGSLEALVAALSSPSDSKVLAAIELLEKKAKGHLVPGLVLYHPSPEVVARALDLFARTRRKDILPFLPRLAGHEYAEVRAAALRAATAIQPDEALLRGALEHHCPVVNVTAIVGLTVGGWIPVAEGVAELCRRAETAPDPARPMIARAIRYQPKPIFVPVLTRLAKDPDFETRREAVLAMRAAHDVELTTHLIRALGERGLREDARDALVELGLPALQSLEQALTDAATPNAVRLHLPRSIARFQSQRAADILVSQLQTESRGVMRFKALRGLGRMVANDPSLSISEEALEAMLASTVASLFQRLHWQILLEEGAAEQPERRTPGHTLLLQLLRDKETLAIERLFRILGLRFRGERWADVYVAIESDDEVARSNGRELLESVLPHGLGRAVVALTSGEPPRTRLEAGAESYEVVEMTYEQLIQRMVTSPGETLKLVATYHAAELDLDADVTSLVQPSEEEPSWIDALRELATRMQRDLPQRLRDARNDA